MALFGSIATVRAQCPAHPPFGVAWPYLADLLQPGSALHARLAAMEVGSSQRHELADGVFVIEQVYAAKSRPEGFFESHQRYIDIQVIVSGEEWMEVAESTRGVVREPYQDARDLVIYQDVAGASLLHLRSGDAAVFFPTDAHMPSLQVGGRFGIVRKSVLKVPVTA